MSRFFPCRYYMLILVLLTACASQPPARQFVTTPVPVTPEASTVSPTATDIAESGYPAPDADTSHSADGRSQSALTSYVLASEVAIKEFDPQAELFAVVPSQIMIGNLGGPPVLPGWFYRFKTSADSRREFIVQVVDTTVTGTTLAESIEEATPRELPIDINQVEIDSSQVFEQFKTVATERNLSTDITKYDFELVNLEGKSGPTWSVVDPVTREWLYSISATSGQEVSNPHQ